MECLRCGSEFTPANSRAKYCSKRCRKAFHKKKAKLTAATRTPEERLKTIAPGNRPTDTKGTCRHCLSEYFKLSSHQLYCSRACSDQARKRKNRNPSGEYVPKGMNNCVTCSKLFKIKQGEASVKYCSKNCRDTARKARYHPRVYRIKCKHCGQEITVNLDKGGAIRTCTGGECREQRKKEEQYRRRLCQYGLTPEKHLKLMDDSKGQCMICLTQHDPKRLVIDHCHDSGIVRGLLCSHCNTMLGFARDNTKTLESAIDYLNQNNPRR